MSPRPRNLPLQSDLFRNPTPPKERESAPAYQPESPTSRAAARTIAPHTLAMRDAVLKCITASGEKGITRKELESATGFLTQTLCARLNELEQQSEIVKLRRLNDSQSVEVVTRDKCAVYVNPRRVRGAA